MANDKKYLTIDEFKERFILEVMKKADVSAEVAKTVCDAHEEIDGHDFDLSENPEIYAWESELSYWGNDE